MALNDDIFDAIVRHQIFLERFKTGTVRALMPLLRKAEDDIERRIVMMPQTPSRERLMALLVQIRGVNTKLAQRLNAEAKARLLEFIKDEAAFSKDVITKSLPVNVKLSLAEASATALQAVVVSEPFQGRMLREWMETMTYSNFLRVRDQLNIGLVEGESVPSIVKRFNDTVKGRTRHELEAVVRTAITHATSGARKVLYAANADVIKAEQWVSTLDGRTSAICRSRDGQSWPVGTEHPFPPAHPNCRSIIVPVVKSLDELGLAGKQLPPGTRASMNGQVPEDVTYEQWFGRQSATFQDEVLGVTRGRLFRQGGLTDMKSYVDDSGHAYTLDQLRRLHPLAFTKAGV